VRAVSSCSQTSDDASRRRGSLRAGRDPDGCFCRRPGSVRPWSAPPARPSAHQVFEHRAATPYPIDAATIPGAIQLALEQPRTTAEFAGVQWRLEPEALVQVAPQSTRLDAAAGLPLPGLRALALLRLHCQLARVLRESITETRTLEDAQKCSWVIQENNSVRLCAAVSL